MTRITLNPTFRLRRAVRRSLAELLHSRSNGWDYGWALAVVAVCTGVVALLVDRFELAALIMVYLTGVVVVAARYGRGPSLLASALSVAALDALFAAPYGAFALVDTPHLTTFAVMFLVAITISGLTARSRESAALAWLREQRTDRLYTLSRELAITPDVGALIGVARRHIGAMFACRVGFYLPDVHGQLCIDGTGAALASEDEVSVIRWVYEHGQPAGSGTAAFPGRRGLYLPLVALHGTTGVLSVNTDQPERFAAPDQRALLETFVNQTALAIERAQLSDQAERAQLDIETERLRNALLSSVSHDLRTPLAAITGAASSLVERGESLDAAARGELAQVAYDEAQRMNRLIGNLLDMTRLESGSIKVQKEWQPLEEVVGTALSRLESRIGARPLTISLPADLPLVPLDSLLIEQVLINLLENALKYTPPDSPITLGAWADRAELIVKVADRGPGLPPGEELRVFDKFYRAQSSAGVGIGLGLTICRGIIDAHGGRIWAANRATGGAVFRFTLPIDGQPPRIGVEDGG